MSKIAFIFPGQGAQKAGMGKDFYENSEKAAEIFDRASELLNIDMKALCFEKNDLLDQTEYTQAALVTTCLAMTEVLKERGLKPDVTAGLSLGEYCAIAVSKGMNSRDAIRAVRQRGILMQTAVPDHKGAMAAVLGMNAEQIEPVLAGIEGVSIANYNCPGQIVITGWRESVESASAALKESGAKRVLPLNVSGPFHSPLLKEAGIKLRAVLDAIEMQGLQIPYVTNVTGGYVDDVKEVKMLLEKQVTSPVRWQQSMENMIKNGTDVFVEVGPGKTLAGFMKKISRDVKVCNVEIWEDIDKVVGELC